MFSNHHIVLSFAISMLSPGPCVVGGDSDGGHSIGYVQFEFVYTWVSEACLQLAGKMAGI